MCVEREGERERERERGGGGEERDYNITLWRECSRIKLSLSVDRSFNNHLTMKKTSKNTTQSHITDLPHQYFQDDLVDAVAWPTSQTSSKCRQTDHLISHQRQPRTN